MTHSTSGATRGFLSFWMILMRRISRYRHNMYNFLLSPPSSYVIPRLVFRTSSVGCASMRQARCLCRSTAVAAPSRCLRKRFIPPWERDGKSAEEFFSGIMQSSNPMQHRRKQQQRMEREQEDALHHDPMSPEDYRRLEELHRHNAEVAERERNFLPYHATPVKYFETSNMAAWGEYTSSLLHTSTGTGLPGSDTYSEETKTLLRNEIHDKIPYRYTDFVAPSSTGNLKWPMHGSAGVVMDLDGVVYRGAQLVPGAKEAVQMLHTLKIPFLFMTNGGGMSEEQKAESLSSLLEVPIDASQVLLAHTPMQLLVERYRESPVLIVGPPSCVEVARGYGFEQAISILQYQSEHPELVPYKKWGDLRTASPGAIPFPRIDAVLQFSDPDDVFSDVQTLVDVLTAPLGQVGRYLSGSQSIPYYVSADDLLWATEAPLPRLGQGAFREMLASVYESVTGQGLEITMYGKPRSIAYAFAAQRIRECSAALGWSPSAMRAMFMIGDNIETDIVGANAAGGKWTSVHVLSGIGSAPAARRTLSEADVEHEWLEQCASKVPHYVAPTLDHFVRELLAFPEQAVLQNKSPYYGKANPVDLEEMYSFTPKF